MKINELFRLHQGNGFELYNMSISKSQDIAFVSRTAQNNGVVAYVEKSDTIQPFPSGWITVALGGSVMSSFVQSKPFYTAFHIMVLEPLKEMSFNEKLFYCMCMQNNAYRYSYGRQANKTLKDIELPDTVPEWTKNITISPIKTSISQIGTFLIDASSWKPFLISNLFDISVSNDKNLQNSDSGDIPYVASSSENNGVTSFINAQASQKSNTLTIARNGSVGSTFYQAKAYCASPDDVRILTPLFQMNKYSALFIKTVIEKEKYKYAYGRKLGTARIKNLTINLPVCDDGTPDFVFMENFIKSLPYSDRI